MKSFANWMILMLSALASVLTDGFAPTLPSRSETERKPSAKRLPHQLYMNGTGPDDEEEIFTLFSSNPGPSNVRGWVSGWDPDDWTK